MLSPILRRIRPYLKSTSNRSVDLNQMRIEGYFKAGRIPWSMGYSEYRTKTIRENLQNPDVRNFFLKKKLPAKFGVGLDERIVEYLWIVSRLAAQPTRILDAGSTFNYDHILKSEPLSQKDLTIFTFHPESVNFNQFRVSYIYGDLRELPFRDHHFDEIVSQSTIEHIDMDNSMYGYDVENHQGNATEKSWEFLLAIQEMMRVLKPGGALLITVPFGKFENHGFFQQFDSEMIARLETLVLQLGGQTTELDFVRYTPDGWEFTSRDLADACESFNPHTGRGRGTDGAAHSRAICCMRFKKNK